MTLRVGALLGALVWALSGCGPGPSAQGIPCLWDTECRMYENAVVGVSVASTRNFICSRDHGYTCQGQCLNERCPDGSFCTEDEECVSDEYDLVDDCADCPIDSGAACALLPPGARRCVAADCEPADPSMRCSSRPGSYACLPDPEVPERLVCWPGGATSVGAPCADSYECTQGSACNAAGRCAAVCVPDPCEGMTCSPEDVCDPRVRDDCPPLCTAARGAEGMVCRDFVCTPMGT